MGSGIAEVCARRGVDVTLVEIDPPRAEATQTAVARSLDRAVRAGKLSAAERDAAVGRVAVTTRLDDLAGAEAAIEAIVEDAVRKRELFARLDARLPEAQLLASNTSSVPIMTLGAATSRPDRSSACTPSTRSPSSRWSRSSARSPPRTKP